MGMFETSRHQSSVAHSQRGLRAKSDPEAISDSKSNVAPSRKQPSSLQFSLFISMQPVYQQSLSEFDAISACGWRKSDITMPVSTKQVNCNLGWEKRRDAASRS